MNIFTILSSSRDSKKFNYIAFSPLVIVGVASPTLVAMVMVFYIMKE